MAKDAGSSHGEWLQITILAGFFTACGFALVSAVLFFFLTPGKAEEARVAADSYEKLKDLLSDRQMKLLRQHAKNSEGQSSTKNLRDIVSESMQGYGLAFSNFPGADSKTMKSGLTEISQSITLQPAPMGAILQFIASVAEAKRSIHVNKFSLKPASRSSDSTEDSWVAQLEFTDFREPPGKS